MSDGQGLLFASLAEDYDRGRGGWPSEICGGIEADFVLDLAAGTGKLTALLAERYTEVVAVEPLATMRKILLHRVPKARALAGTAEAIPLDDESVDAVFVAEAFHWFDSAAAAQEIQRVLRPGGWLVISFNVPSGGFEPGLSEEAEAVLEHVCVSAELPPAGLPKVLSGAWRRGLASFEPLSQIDLDHEWTTDTVGVASYFVSVSSMGALAHEARVELRRRLVELTPAATHRWRLTAHIYRGRRP